MDSNNYKMSRSKEDGPRNEGFDSPPPYNEIEMRAVYINNENELKECSQSIAANISKEKLYIFKDLFIVSLSFLLLFTAFQALQSLQSSLNSDQGIGTKSLSIIYAVMIVGNIIYAPFIVIHIGCKYTLGICILMYCAYILANFYAPYFYITLIIGALILGSAGAPLWTAQSTYTNIIGLRYAEITKQDPRTVLPRFFGIFAFIFQSAQIWGNLISAAVLKDDKNLTQDLSKCGYYFRSGQQNSSNNTNLNRPPDETVFMLCGIYLACGLVASATVFIFLANRKNPNIQSSKLSMDMFTKTLKLAIFDSRQTMLIVITIYTGLETAFITSDFTSAYISCSWGTDKVGLVMWSFGAFNCLGSIFFGAVTKWVGRIPIITLAAVINIAILIALMYWQPDPNESYVFFIIASLWGAGDAVWQSQMSALYGNIFCDNQEAGFSNKGVWESIGFMMAFAYSSFLTIDIKMYILFGFLAVGMPLYYVTEFLDWKKRRQ